MVTRHLLWTGLLLSVAACGSDLPRVTAEELRGDIRPDQLIDVRSDEEWQAGHITGAWHIPVEQAVSLFPSRFPDRSTRLVLYCKSGRRATRAATALREIGYTGLTVVDGGYSDLVRAGFPASSPATAP